MRSLSLIVLAVTMLYAAPSVGGIIELTDEPYRDYCASLDQPGLKTIYVQHYAVGGFTGCRFRIQTGPGNTMTFVSEVHHVPGTVGDTQSGMTVCYDGCTVGPRILLATITYMQYGTSENCSRLFVVPHPAAETVEEIDCDYRATPAYVHDFTVISPGEGCGCPPIHVIPGNAESFGCGPLAVEQTTWGGIKALYR